MLTIAAAIVHTSASFLEEMVDKKNPNTSLTNHKAVKINRSPGMKWYFIKQVHRVLLLKSFICQQNARWTGDLIQKVLLTLRFDPLPLNGRVPGVEGWMSWPIEQWLPSPFPLFFLFILIPLKTEKIPV